MQGIINGEIPFKCLKETFAVAPSSVGYTLNYAVSPEGPWTAWPQATPAGETLVVNGVTPYMYFKLAGNTDNNVKAIF